MHGRCPVLSKRTKTDSLNRTRNGFSLSLKQKRLTHSFFRVNLFCVPLRAWMLLCVLSSWHSVATALTASLAHLLALLLCVLHILLILLGCKNGFHLLVAYLLPLFA